MKTTMAVLLALLLALPVVALAGGDKNQNQYGKEDGTPGNGDQVKERERPDEPQGDCPDCPNCDCPKADDETALATGVPIRSRDGDCDCDNPDCDGPYGPNGPQGPGDGNGPNGPNGDGDGEGGDGPFGPNAIPE